MRLVYIYIYLERNKTTTFTSVSCSALQEGNPVTKHSAAFMALKGNVHAITGFMAIFFLRVVNKEIKEIDF